MFPPLRVNKWTGEHFDLYKTLLGGGLWARVATSIGQVSQRSSQGESVKGTCSLFPTSWCITKG